MINQSLLKTSLLSGLALVAFAANSVLCRLALESERIDASSFTVIRLLSGAFVLFLILSTKSHEKDERSKGSWLASFMLFVYAISFSYAYLSIDTGTGALILFGSVQMTMIFVSLLSGRRLHVSEWMGVFIAFAGFVYLILPSITAPSMIGFILMALSGIAWGLYTLMGRGSKNPLMDTAYNFLRTLPFVSLLALMTLHNATFTNEGVVFALISGGITSGIGYTIWYIALRGLNAIQASVLQLSVPVIAAIGGVMFVSESMTYRLIISTCIVLCGILTVVLGKQYSLKVESNFK